MLHAWRRELAGQKAPTPAAMKMVRAGRSRALVDHEAASGHLRAASVLGAAPGNAREGQRREVVAQALG